MEETQEMRVGSLSQEDSLQKEMATHSGSCLGNPMDRGMFRAAVHGVAELEIAEAAEHTAQQRPERR